MKKSEIKEFEEDLISHGMRPKHKKWFSNYVYFYFDKGKSTDTDILTNYKDWVPTITSLESTSPAK